LFLFGLAMGASLARFFGSQTRKAQRAYLLERTDDLPALWVTDDRTAGLTYGGLRPS
jgi:hypothetical protein